MAQHARQEPRRGGGYKMRSRDAGVDNRHTRGASRRSWVWATGTAHLSGGGARGHVCGREVVCVCVVGYLCRVDTDVVVGDDGAALRRYLELISPPIPHTKVFLSVSTVG